MRLIKKFLFIPILAVVFVAQAATSAPTTPQLDSPLNTLVIYSGAAITMGASSVVGGDLHVVEGATLGASAEFGGNIEAGAAVTLGASSKVGGNITAGAAASLGMDARVSGNVTAGDAATLGATSAIGTNANYIMVEGNLKAGAAVLLGAKSVVTGNVTSGAATPIALGDSAEVRGYAKAGTGLTLGADATVGFNPDPNEPNLNYGLAGTGPIELGDRAQVAGDATAGTSITLAPGASIGGTARENESMPLTDDPKPTVENAKTELTQLQATLSAEVAPLENQLIATMPADRTLKAGVYHAADLTTTAGITLTFDGENKDGNWLINADTYIAFGAEMKMVLKDVTPNSTITWNSKGYISIGAGSATVKAEVLGTFYAADYITTGAQVLLKGTHDRCGGLFTTNGYITLGATNTMGLIGCTVGPYVPMAPDHFLISHDTSGIHCAPETVSVSAKNLDSSTTTGYTGTITLDTQLPSSTGTWSLLTGKGFFNDATDNNGEATYTFDAEDEGVAVFSLYYPDGAATFNIDVFDNANSTIRDKELDPEHNITFAASGFTVTAEALTDLSSIDNNIPTQIAGSAFNLHLTAYGTSANDPQCGIIETYTADKEVTLVTTYINHSDGTVAATGGGKIEFSDGRAVIRTIYKDVGRIQLTFRDDGTPAISGTSNSFVVKPHSYLISLSDGETGSDYEANSATDSTYKKAGKPFTVTVTARSFDESTTPNFGNESSPSVTVDLSHLLARPNNEDDGFTGVPGMLNGTWSNHINNSGRFSGDYSFNEVGIIDLTASINYLGTGIVTTTLSSIGRFTPASLSLTVINDGTFISANTDGALNFTYVGQPFSYDPDNRPSFKVTALNAFSNVTKNYSGAAWGKLNATSIALTKPTWDEIQHGTLKPDGTSTRMALAYVQDPEGFRDPTITANQPAAVNGIFNAAFTNDQFTYNKDSNSQISPFTPNVNLIITKVTDADEIISTGSITLNPTGPEPIRFGRMRMDSEHGSEIEPLEMAYQLEYFDSPDWLLHDDKNSTITTGDISSNPTGISATSIKRTTPEGKFYITLSPPGLGNDGAYTITTDVLGSEEPWLQYDWENDDNFDDNPRSTATFGIYKGNSHQIFSRQAFQ
jgi:predicted acyltransferase (DUF342 family)